MTTPRDRVEHEELHDATGATDPDAPIHPDSASAVEANVTRPAGPDVAAEDVAARGYDPAGPESEPERSERDG